MRVRNDGRPRPPASSERGEPISIALTSWLTAGVLGEGRGLFLWAWPGLEEGLCRWAGPSVRAGETIGGAVCVGGVAYRACPSGGRGLKCGRGFRDGRGLWCGAGPMGQLHPTEWEPCGAAPRCSLSRPSRPHSFTPLWGRHRATGQRYGVILGGHADWAPRGAPPGAVGPAAVALSPLSRSRGRPSPWDRWRAGGGDQDTEWLV